MEEIKDGLKESLRIEKLEKIKATEEPIMTGVILPYKGSDKAFNVYKIPLEYLVYNPHNGRIGTRVKTFEATSHKLNPEDKDDIKIIEKYLWESKKSKNQDTETDLKKYHQRQFGIVSRNGFIIDGNRRASLLNKLYREREKHTKEGFNVDHTQYFNAVILDDDADEKEILKLETTYQMGMDEKLDYNPIEKYLKCRRLQKVGYSVSDISTMMRITAGKVEENLNILNTMDEYLEYNGYNEMYSMLDGREDQLISTNAAFNAYKNRNLNAYTDWPIEDYDIEKLKNLAFDYVRAQYEGKEFRNILRNGRKINSFFSCKKIWDSFSGEHEENLKNLQEEDIEDFLKNYQGDRNDITEILNSRDNDWKNRIINKLTGNLEKHKEKLLNLQQSDRPNELLERAQNALNSIDVNQSSLSTKENLNLVKEINSICWDLRKSIENGLKHE